MIRTGNLSLGLLALSIWLALCLQTAGEGASTAGTTSLPSQPSVMRGPPGQAIIFGRDNRTHVADTTQFPWSAIGQVVSDYGFELAIGTGALIGNKTVLTAGHVIYDQQSAGRSPSRSFPGSTVP